MLLEQLSLQGSPFASCLSPAAWDHSPWQMWRDSFWQMWRDSFCQLAPGMGSLRGPCSRLTGAAASGPERSVLPEASVPRHGRPLPSPDSPDPRGGRSPPSGPGVRFKVLTRFHQRKLPLNCSGSKSAEHVSYNRAEEGRGR